MENKECKSKFFWEASFKDKGCIKGVSAKMSLRVRMLKKLQSPKLAIRSFGNIFPILSDKFLERENYSHSN